METGTLWITRTPRSHSGRRTTGRCSETTDQRCCNRWYLNTPGTALGDMHDAWFFLRLGRKKLNVYLVGKKLGWGTVEDPVLSAKRRPADRACGNSRQFRC